MPQPVELPREIERARNLVEVFEIGVAKLGDRTAARFKQAGSWLAISWRELGRRARDVSDGLAALGVARGDRIAILAETAVEWIVADLGILGAGAITVPIYQSNPPQECRYILENSEASWIFVDGEAQAEKIRQVRDRLPGLKGLIRFTGSVHSDFEGTLQDLESTGAQWRRSHAGAHPERLAAIGKEDAASYLYTSGTTGNPKGVVLTHGNWVYEALAVAKLDIINARDQLLMFLPMAHSFAKVIEAAWFAVGAEMAFVESIEKIVDNAHEVRPTIVPSVPRIFEKAYNAVLAKGLETPGIKGRLFQIAMEGFEEWVGGRIAGQEHSGLFFLLGRKLVFPRLASALSERFGGRIRLFISGSAPLAPKIAWFFNLLGFTILEGWGLTETSAGTCVNRPGCNQIGTVGPPVPGTEIRIAPDGEVLVKGGGVMKEYHRNPSATAEAFRDGWFCTGDIGELTADGCLRITDRKKDIIVTAGGKNVSPQNLESELKADPLFSQVMVHGDKRKFLSVLLTLNQAYLRQWATENGISLDGDFASNPRVQARVQQAIDELNAKQASYATIKRFAILSQELTQEAGEITPTSKVKRAFVSQKYKEILDSFYVE